MNWEEKLTKLAKSNSTLPKLMNTSEVLSNKTKSMEQPQSLISSREMFLVVYTCVMGVGTLCYITRSFSFFRMCLRISVNLHDMIFRGVTRAKMIFFNNNPSGRILNRFARDINNIDSLLPCIMIDVIDVS